MRCSRASARLERDVGVLIAGLARSVHAGATLRGALGEAAGSLTDPLASDLATILDGLGRGAPIDSLLSAWARARRSDALDLLASAGRLAAADGGDLAGALEAAAVAAIDRVEVADEAAALATQARTSALVLGLLPAFGSALFCLLDPAVARTLLTTSAGWACLVVGMGANLAGVVALRAITSRVLR
jgi:tight adherence protein B